MIFYFSGTGNSGYVADKIKKEFDGDLINMSLALKERQFEYTTGENEKVFFIFPVYFCGLPSLVKEFINQVKFKDRKPEACGIATYGTSVCGVDKILKSALKNSNADFKAFYKIKMVENYILMFKLPRREEQLLILRKADREIKEMIDSIKFNYRINYKSGFGMKFLSHIMQIVYNISRNTKKFTVKDNCTGCGLCERICPIDAISLKDGKPMWNKKKCVHCLGCIHRCPEEAIEYGKKTKGKGRFTNPTLKQN